MENIEHINEWNEIFTYNKLIDINSMGWIRDGADFRNALYHSFHSLSLAKQIILAGGTNEEKLKYIEKVMKEIQEEDKKIINNK